MTVYRTICIRALYSRELADKIKKCVDKAHTGVTMGKILDNMVRLEKSVNINRFYMDKIYVLYGCGKRYVSLTAPEYIITPPFAQLLSKELSEVCIYSFLFDNSIFKFDYFELGEKLTGCIAEKGRCSVFNADMFKKVTGINEESLKPCHKENCGLSKMGFMPDTKEISLEEILGKIECNINALLKIDYDVRYNNILLKSLENVGFLFEQIDLPPIAVC